MFFVKPVLYATRVPQFQRSYNLFLSRSQGTGKGLVVLDAGVMQRFERVVALPNPKVLNFPAALTLFRNFGLQVQ